MRATGTVEMELSHCATDSTLKSVTWQLRQLAVGIRIWPAVSCLVFGLAFSVSFISLLFKSDGRCDRDFVIDTTLADISHPRTLELLVTGLAMASLVCHAIAMFEISGASGVPPQELNSTPQQLNAMRTSLTVFAMQALTYGAISFQATDEW